MTEQAVCNDNSRSNLNRWWRSQAIASVDHISVIERVEQEAVWSPRYLFMTLISAGIALLGLLLSSPAVVIGAMLISPLIGPIVGLGFSLALFDFKELRRSILALALGVLIAVLFTAAISLLSPLQTVTAEIAARTRPNLFDLLVALLSALAGAYAMIRGQSGTIVGVAIATALMPPLAVVGFGLATWNWPVFSGAILLFVTNFVTITLTVMAVARFYGFGGHLTAGQTRLQGILLTIILVGLAFPLALALRQIGWESVASRQIRDAALSPFSNQARISQIDVDYDRDPIQVRAIILTRQFRPDAERLVHERLRNTLSRPAEVHIDQVRIGSENSDSAQVAAAGRPGDNSRDLGATLSALMERLTLAADAGEGAVTIDRERRHAVVNARSLAGANMSTYREMEQRIGRDMDGWSITLVPPPAPLPVIGFNGEVPDPAALDAATWAGQRLRLPIGVSGTAARADEIVSALEKSGVAARKVGSKGDANGSVRLSWAPLGNE
ncbi:hypothetical protein CLG96_03000 [Sphingomonas oleivorans]|uniref:TIGR00341 family protein n=1 Tax=Sphingomonas oleivorans TaxID=1735121 RepID=A0A2T5G1T2_9SPHN|nr:DUF389 domain-containing protein [Sphingomonas oleivorans]PTQ13113.1 hypothetical protein CLG96_03000 [Sphingomonas oleivorans]